MSALTKILIVLQLVFALLLSMLIVLMVSKQENYRQQVGELSTASLAQKALIGSDEAKLAAAQADATNWQTKYSAEATGRKTDADQTSARLTKAASDLLAAESQRSQALNQVTVLSNSVDALKAMLAEKDKELSDLRPKVADLTGKNADLYRASNEKDTQLRAAEQAIRKLQEQLAAAPQGGAAAPAGGENPVVSASAQRALTINARISDIAQSAGRTLIALPLGTRDGVSVNAKFAIYRDKTYVGDAVVQRVTADESVAVVESLKPGQSVQKGDMVMSGN